MIESINRLLFVKNKYSIDEAANNFMVFDVGADVPDNDIPKLKSELENSIK